MYNYNNKYNIPYTSYIVRPTWYIIFIIVVINYIYIYIYIYIYKITYIYMVYSQ